MSTTQAPDLAPLAQEAASFLRLFRGGVFEDNFLDVSRLDPGVWESVRAELEEAALLTVEWGVLLAGRPYLRLPATKEPAPPPTAAPGRASQVLATVQARHVEAYRALTVAVRQAFHAPSPKHGMEIMAREEANFRQAVGWARALGDTECAAEMGDVVTRYLERVGRTGDRDRWVASLAAPVEEAAAAPITASPARPEATRPSARESPQPPQPVEEGAVQATPEPPAPLEPAGASPEGVAVPPRETEGAQWQREGTAAVAEGQIALAAELYQRALRWFQDARDTAGVAGTCELFGAMEEAAGRPDAARVWYERAASKRGQ